MQHNGLALAVALCCLALPTQAQLTGAGQVNRLCAQLLKAKAAGYSPANVAAIDAACGSKAAIDATIAGGNAAFTALRNLHKAVMVDFNAVLAGPG